MTSKTEVCYSADGEVWQHTGIDDLFSDMDDDGRLEVGETYYEADFETIDLAKMFCIESILETAEERLWDLIGETSEDAFAVSAEAKADLRAVLADWTKRHLGSSAYWKCVGNVRELSVAADDIAGYSAKPGEVA